MKGKLKLRCLALVIALLVLIPTACTPPESRLAGEPGAAEVWSAHSGVKIMRDITYSEPERGPASLSVSMAKNEYESVQLILTASSDITGYNLTAAGLTDGKGNAIPVSDISLYNQWYMETKNSVNRFYPSGWYPDALVPLDKAIAHGDAKISKGDNQGIWVKFKTGKDTHAGTYTGAFMLNVDGEVSQIPVTVKVWDITVPDEVTTKSSFLLYGDGLTRGEGNSSLEMRKAYFDYFLEYRISLMNLPCDNDPDAFVESLREYHGNPKLSAYNIPYISKDGNIDVERLALSVNRMVTASVEDGTDYLEKAYVYNLFTDEYDATRAIGKYNKVLKWMPAFKQMRTDVESYFDTACGAGYLDSVPGLRQSLQTLLDLEVATFMRDVSDQANGLVTGFGHFQTQEERDFLRSFFNDPGDELWWYGCIGPYYPYPSYHIDDNALSARLLSWMQYDYKIDGNLYYMVNQFFGDAGTYDIFPIGDDIWTTANHNLGGGKAQGDGWLVYPGSRYGVYGPIGTIRLENIRDGLEEYEILRLLDDKLELLADGYEQPDMNVCNFLRSTLDSVYTGTWATTSAAAVETARNTIADSMFWAENYGVVAGEIRHDRAFIETDVFLPGDATIDTGSLAEGTTVTAVVTVGSGQKISFKVYRGMNSDTVLRFDFNLDAEAIVYTRFLDSALADFLALDSDDIKQYVGVSANSAITLDTIDGIHALRFDLASTNDPVASLISRPYVSFNNKFIGLIEPGVNKLIFEIYNGENFDITVEFVRRTEILDDTDTSVTIKANSWTQCVLPIVNISEILSYRMYLPNRIVSSVAQNQTIYISNVYAG